MGHVVETTGVHWDWDYELLNRESRASRRLLLSGGHEQAVRYELSHCVVHLQHP